MNIILLHSSILFLALFVCFSEHLVQADKKGLVCQVGQEKDGTGAWRWVLPYADPCQCKSIIYGGVNIDTPRRPFHPTYVDTPFVGNNIEEIRAHYNLKCNGKGLKSPFMHIQGVLGKLNLTKINIMSRYYGHRSRRKNTQYLGVARKCHHYFVLNLGLFRSTWI